MKPANTRHKRPSTEKPFALEALTRLLETAQRLEEEARQKNQEAQRVKATLQLALEEASRAFRGPERRA